MAVYDYEHRSPTGDYDDPAYETTSQPGWLTMAAGAAFILFILYAVMTGPVDRPQQTEIPQTTTTAPAAPLTQPE